MNKRAPESKLESRRVIGGVFDSATSATLYKLSKKYDLVMDGLVSIGKEANVYCGHIKDKKFAEQICVAHAADSIGIRHTPESTIRSRARTEGSVACYDKRVAIKIYRIEAGDFNLMRKYIVGDLRCHPAKNKRRLIYEWAKREFLNMSRVSEFGFCPEPVAFQKNVLVMGLVTYEDGPAPKLKDAVIEDAGCCFNKVVECIKGMYSKGLVHGDLSEYNILVSDEDKPVLIDFSMGALVEDPIAQELLHRDIRNVTKYFRKFGVDANENDVLGAVTGG